MYIWSQGRLTKAKSVDRALSCILGVAKRDVFWELPNMYPESYDCGLPVFPCHRGLAIPTGITARGWRHSANSFSLDHIHAYPHETNEPVPHQLFQVRHYYLLERVGGTRQMRYIQGPVTGRITRPSWLIGPWEMKLYFQISYLIQTLCSEKYVKQFW